MEETKIKLVPRSQGGSSSYPSRWSQANLSSPLPVVISSDFNGDFDASDLDGNGYDPIEQAMNTWNQAHASLDFFSLPAGSTTNLDSSNLDDYRDGVLGIYKLYSWFPSVSSDTIAITRYYGYLRNVGASNEYLDLTHADIVVNYDNYTFSTNPTGVEFDLETVILHELGHFIGLQHPTGSDYFVPAVMQSSLSETAQKRTLFAYDISALENNYTGYSASLTHFKGAAAVRDFSPPEHGEEVSGYHELKRDGRCYQWMNGKLVHIHQH